MAEGTEDQGGGVQKALEQEAKPTILEQVARSLKDQLKDNSLFRSGDVTTPEGLKIGTAMAIVSVLTRAGVFQDTGHRGVRLVVEGFEARSLEDTLKMYRDQMNKESRENRIGKRIPDQVSVLAEEQVPEESVLDLSEEEVVAIIGQLPPEYLVSCVLQRLQREAEYRGGVIKGLETDKDDLTRQLAEKESEVLRVRQELVGARTEVLQLQADLARAREVRPLSPVQERMYADPRPAGEGCAQGGGSGPARGAFRPVQIHRRPLTGHVSGAVQVVVKKKNGN